MDQLKKFSVGEDCPVFEGLYRYCQVWSPSFLTGFALTMILAGYVCTSTAGFLTTGSNVAFLGHDSGCTLLRSSTQVALLEAL